MGRIDDLRTEEPEAPSSARISVIIVDDEDLARALLTAALGSSGNIEIVGAFADAETAIEAVRRLHPEVVVLEIELRGALTGIEAGLVLRREFPDIGIVWLSAYKRPYVPVSFQLTTGWAYLLKTSGTDVRTLTAAIDGVANGLVVLDPEIAATMNRLRSEWLPRLSVLEHDVLALMAQGLSNAGIAQALDVPEPSVRGHIDQIYRHLGLRRGADVKHRRVEAVLAYLRGGETRTVVLDSPIRTTDRINEPQPKFQQVENMPPHVVLAQSAFVERVHEEIARCLRTRRHLSVALLAARAADVGGQGLAASPDALRSVAEDLARHIRAYDLVAVSRAEVMLMFPEATRERTSVILGRLRATTAALPGVPPGGSPPLWGLATWPADGNDPTALLETARHRLSAT